MMLATSWGAMQLSSHEGSNALDVPRRAGDALRSRASRHDPHAACLKVVCGKAGIFDKRICCTNIGFLRTGAYHSGKRWVMRHRAWLVLTAVLAGRGSHSFPFQLNLSSSVHRVTQQKS
jgi:hypothetical protein